MIATRSLPQRGFNGHHEDRTGNVRDVVDMVMLYLPLAIFFLYTISRVFSQLFHG